MKNNEIRIPAGEFKAHCLKIMDEITEGHTTYVVTKRGKPVVKITSYQSEPDALPALFGALAGQAVIRGNLLESSGEEWNESKFDDFPSA